MWRIQLKNVKPTEKASSHNALLSRIELQWSLTLALPTCWWNLIFTLTSDNWRNPRDCRSDTGITLTSDLEHGNWICWAPVLMLAFPFPFHSLPSPFPLCLPDDHYSSPEKHTSSLLTFDSPLSTMDQFSLLRISVMLYSTLVPYLLWRNCDFRRIVWMNLSTLAYIGNRQSKPIHELVGNHTTINHVMYFLPCYHDNIQKGFQRLPSVFVSYLIFLARN